MVSGEGRIVQKSVRSIAIVAFALAALAAGPAHAEKRVALLLGNQAYTSEIGPLANPHNDVALLEKALRGLGFEVASVRDAGLADMHQAINAYVRRTREAGPGAVGFLYYAGHGASDASINYLIPVDVKSAEEGDLWDRSLRVTEIVRKLKAEAGNATHFVVLDACRNTLKLRKAGSKAVVQSRGLIRVTEEAGMLIAYATAEGELASDVGAGAGPYARVLAEEIVKPGVEAVTMFRNVQRRVRAAIRQEPHLQFSALGDVYLAGPAPLQPAPSQAAETARICREVEGMSNLATLAVLERQHKGTPAGECVAAQIGQLQAVALSVPKPESAVGVFNPSRAAVPLTPAEERALKPGNSFKECDNCSEMMVVPAGSLMMGSPDAEPGRRRIEGPVRKVEFRKPFAAGRYAITRDEFSVFVTATGHRYGESCHVPVGDKWMDKSKHTFLSPPGFIQDGRHPAVCVSWSDAVAYARWLSAQTGKAYRLFTEAEREYIARAGTATPYWWGVSVNYKLANYDTRRDAVRPSPELPPGCPREGTSPVGCFAPNPWGFFQVHGNVAEWTQDCWNRDYKGAPIDGSAALTGDCSRRVLRGGAWNYWPEDIRAAYREAAPAEHRYFHVGFRMARDVAQ